MEAGDESGGKGVERAEGRGEGVEWVVWVLLLLRLRDMETARESDKE